MMYLAAIFYGATSISFMNPNSRSQTIEMDENIDEKDGHADHAGKDKNCRYENPTWRSDE